MRTSAFQLARLALLLAVAGWLVPAGGADAKPDKKKWQVAMQRGRNADNAGQRDQAIAAFSEAIKADGSSAEAWRARGRDYQAVGNRWMAQEDFEEAIEVQPGDAENYLARGDFFAAIKQTERAIHDYTDRKSV